MSHRRGDARARVSMPILWGIALGIAAPSARAQTAPRLCVDGPPDNPIVERLASELTSSGFVVTTSSSTVSGPPAFDDKCDAVARIVLNTGIEVWWMDHRAGTATELEAFPTAAPDDPEGALAAVRAAELVRARLLPAGRALAASPEASTAAPAPIPAPASAPSGASSPTAPTPQVTAARFGLDAGGMVLLSPGGVPPSASLVVMPRWILTHRLAVHAAVSVPLTFPEVSATEGRASVTEWLISAAVEWSVLPSREEWGIDAGVGAGVCDVRTQGIANPPYLSTTGNAWTWVPLVEAAASRTLWSPQVRVELVGFLGAAWPEVRIRFSGRDVASWGHPLVGAALALQTNVF